MNQPDFSGWTTIENLPCSDQRGLPEGERNTHHPQFFRLYNLFSLVTYKPGTRIVVEPEKTRCCVNVWIPTVDSNHPEETYEGRFYMWAEYRILEQHTDIELLNWLMRNTAAFETHEVMEFFKVGGMHLRSPHPTGDPMQGDYMSDCAKIWPLQPKVV